MVDHMLDPGEVGVALGRNTIAPALVVGQPFSSPVRDVEWWIGENEVGFQVRMTVVMEAVAVGNLPLDPTTWRGSFWQAATSCSSIPDRRSRCRLAPCHRCRCRWCGRE